MSQLIGSVTSILQVLTCGSTITLAPNQPYNLSSIFYPFDYVGAITFSCSVNFNAPDLYNVKSNCNVELPNANSGCTADRLEFSRHGRSNEKYCGNIPNLQVQSTNNSMRIAFAKPLLSYAGGRFTCRIEVVPDPCQCGRRNRVTARIVGGKETGVNEFPMMAGLVYSGNRVLYCGATIINPTTVVTAAHCVAQIDETKIGVVVGEHDTTTGSETNNTRLYRVDSVIIHEEYRSNEENYPDIALVKILGTMDFNYGVSAVCLPYRYENDNIEGMTVEALGWGLLQFGDSKATTLQKVSLVIKSSEQCPLQDSPIGPESFCTFTQGKDTCQMDSGGPLLYTDEQNVVYLFGVIAESLGCASDSPSYHTKVMSYWKWIEQHTPDTRYCST